LIKNLDYRGLLFESLVVRDVSVYAQACGAQLFRYNDNANFEVDVIVEGSESVWGAIEIKLGAGQTAQASANLPRFKKTR
jgi:hypothetical protein